MPMNPEGGLAGLVAALQGGMDPTQAFGIVQYLEQEEQSRMANRAQRLGGLASLLTEAASGGMPYGGAEALAQAQPGPAGPAVQNMLQSLYPGAESQPPGDLPMGAWVPPDAAAQPTGDQALSPAYMAPQQAPMSPLEQQQFAMNEQDMQAQAMDQQNLVNQQASEVITGVRTAALQAKTSGKTPAEFIQDIMSLPTNAAVLGQYEQAVGDILREVWASEEVAQSPWHAALGT
jgi:hypothetical protein